MVPEPEEDPAIPACAGDGASDGRQRLVGPPLPFEAVGGDGDDLLDSLPFAQQPRAGDPNARIARPAWFGRLCQDLAGTPERNEANVIIALTSDMAFAGVLAFDEFAREIVVRQPLPWDDPGATFPRPWEDADDVRTAEWLQLRGLNVAPMVVSRAVGAVARELRIHPVRDWLDTLKWDGKPRIEAWTSTYLGAEPTAFHHTVGALWLISAVARIYRPGVKADHMLILEGPQGARKSTAIKVLAGEDWFTDELPELGSKDAAIHMQGVWIVEIAELDAIGRAEVSRIKAFLTRTTDRFRPPYGRYTVEVPRQTYAAAVLVARMEDASLDHAPVWDDVGTFDGRPWRGAVDIVTAGYPCQPFSVAGKRRGADDPRHLWPHVARIIGEVEPPFVFLENVAHHLRLGSRRRKCRSNGRLRSSRRSIRRRMRWRTCCRSDLAP